MRILLDTNLLVDADLLIDSIDSSAVVGLPSGEQHDFFCSALSYAELQEGEFSHNTAIRTKTPLEYIRAAEAFGEGLPFDDLAAYLYRVVCRAVVEQGRQVGRRRRVDLMIAATALANDCVLATRNIADFRGLEPILTVMEL